jgi:hypothetical protein
MTPMRVKIMFSTMIGIPAYEGKIGSTLATTLIQLTRARRDVGVFCINGRASLSLVRDELIATFLANKEATTLVMIDTDVLCSASQIIDLIEAPYRLISACVPPRSEHANQGQYFTGELLFNGDDEQDLSGVVEAVYLPCSMLKVSKEALIEVLRSGSSKPVSYMDSGNQFYNWFPCGVSTGRMLTEAYYFTQMMRANGIKAWIDFDIRVGHAR